MSTQKLRELMQRFGLIISFLLLCAILALLSDRFLTVNNAVNVLRQSTINGIIAVCGAGNSSFCGHTVEIPQIPCPCTGTIDFVDTPVIG